MNEQLVNFLMVLATGGATGIVASFLGENLPWYQAQPPHVKRWLFLALSLILPLVGWALLALVGSAEWTVETALYYVMLGGFASFGGGQLTHGEIKRRRGSW